MSSIIVLLLILFAIFSISSIRNWNTKKPVVSVAQPDLPIVTHTRFMPRLDNGMVGYTGNRAMYEKTRFLPIIGPQYEKACEEINFLRRFEYAINKEVFFKAFMKRLFQQDFELPLVKMTAPTHAIHVAQQSLFTLFVKEDWARALNLLRNLEKSLSLLSVKRILMRIETSREKDILPIFEFLGRRGVNDPAHEYLLERVAELTDSDTRVGSELLIDIEKADFPAGSKLMTWIKSDKSAQAFIEGLITDQAFELKDQVLDYVIAIIHEILTPFDYDRTLRRGSITILGEAGIKLKALFDLIGIYEYKLDSSQSVDTIPLPAFWRNISANTMNYFASFMTEMQPLQSQKIFYNRTGASSHYTRCEYSQFGIDVAPGRLPFHKHHILYGRTYKGDFWFKLEEHGLADATSFVSHGRDYACSKIFPVAKEPIYRC